MYENIASCIVNGVKDYLWINSFVFKGVSSGVGVPILV